MSNLRFFNFGILHQFWIFGVFDELLSTQNVNVARLVAMLNETFSVIFKHHEYIVNLSCILLCIFGLLNFKSSGSGSLQNFR